MNVLYLSAHDGHADEDGGHDDGDLGEKEDERADRVDGGHPHHVRHQHLEGAPGRRAEIVAVYCCNKYQVTLVTNHKN